MAAAPVTAELATGGHTVSYVSADLGSLESVRSAATEIRDRLDSGDLPPLRGFVGNAGMQYTNALTEGPDGFESTFTVNVLANHLFVRLLQDRFAAPARIVITASDTHFGAWMYAAKAVPLGIFAAALPLISPGTATMLCLMAAAVSQAADAGIGAGRREWGMVAGPTVATVIHAITAAAVR